MFVLPLSRSASLTRSVARSPSFDRFIDRLFDESIDRLAGTAPVASNARAPAMDVSESDSAYTIAFDVPGASRDELKVSVEGRRVALTTVPVAADAPADKAATPAADAKPVDRRLYRERAAAVYARTISLPAEVDQQASQAKFENGVLTLVLAKKVATGAIQLQIV
jgi:HSP20 family protein